MKIELTPAEARVIGCLIEKELTTPDQYPLSLNALTLACNQKTNRDPVTEYDDATVQATLDELGRKHLVIKRDGERVAKYRHRFAGTEFSELKVTAQQRGVLCVLLLRGAQTPGELRTRTNRLCDFADVAEVERTLADLAAWPDGALVARLPRSPGERESRYVHLFSGPVDAAGIDGDEPVHRTSTAATTGLEARVATLEQQVADLQAELRRLQLARGD